MMYIIILSPLLIDVPAMTEFLAEQSKKFSMEQARIFGTLLKDYIGGSIKDMKSTIGMNLVLEIFDHMNRRSESLPMTHISKVLDALKQAAGCDSSPSTPGIQKLIHTWQDY